ncbi:MAG: tRNA 2-thiocytidine(32) synthetase TtcA, partial [Bacteroidaceae bacterium]|nr:tRNA 2-thiocytidine(32) synthetase TtcA [Bacteroidaceae bacterium]
PIEIIRPLCKVAEKDIEEYALEEEWKGQKKNCPFEEVTQRKQISQIAKELLNIHPEIRHNLWKSMQNVQKDRLPDKKGRK